jgi:prophage regulatory protein
MTQHRIFKLPMAAVLKVLVQNGAEEVAAESHTPSPQSAAKKQSRLLSYKELKSLKGISYVRQHIDRLEEAGKFPKRIKIGARVYWYEHEVDEYVRAHAEARSLKNS